MSTLMNGWLVLFWGVRAQKRWEGHTHIHPIEYDDTDNKNNDTRCGFLRNCG